MPNHFQDVLVYTAIFHEHSINEQAVREINTFWKSEIPVKMDVIILVEQLHLNLWTRYHWDISI